MPCCKLRMKRGVIVVIVAASAVAGVIGWTLLSPQLMVKSFKKCIYV